MIHEDCGLFSIYGHVDAARLTYFGLYAQQHRGQESAGIVSVDDAGDIHDHRGMGLVPDIFEEKDLQALPGTIAVGHVRYSTTGRPSIANAQPLLVNHKGMNIAIAHNGNLVNTFELRSRLEDEGAIFRGTSDTEVIMHLLVRELAHHDPVEAIRRTCQQLRGAYCLIFLLGRLMVAVRDPYGFHPLSVGRLDGAPLVASETCAFDLMDAEYEHCMKPGEMFIVSENIDLTTKPTAYLARSIFSDEPTVHLCFQEQSRDIEWNGVKQRIRQLTDHWTRTPGEQLNLTVYTNCDEVEIIVNGRSLGRKQNDRTNPKVRNQVRWDKLTYEPGYIEAIARTGGKIVARHREETAGPAVALRLIPDLSEAIVKGKSVNSKSPWHADGLDLQHVTVEAVDKKGRVVPAANLDVHFAVEGDARLVAVSSGDHYSDELVCTGHRRLFLGRALAILRAGRTPAEVTLTATADGLKPARLKMQTR